MQRVLVIRPDRSAAAMAARLRREGFDALACPISHIEQRNAPMPDAYDGILLTSPHALHESIASRLRAGAEVFCVGRRAAEAAQEAGLHVVFTADDSTGLLQHLLAHRKDAHFLYLSGADIHADLAQAGLSLTRVITYEAVAATALPGEVVALLRDAQPCLALMTSARSSRIFGALLRQHGLDASALRAIAISPAVAEVARSEGIPCPVVADAPNEEALVAALRISC